MTRINAGGTITARTIDNTGNVAAERTSVRGYGDGLWHQMTAVISTNTSTGAGNDITLYMDGVLDQGSLSATSNPYRASNVSVKIGVLADLTAGTYFTGPIDDVRVYNYARTPAQIAWDYNQGKPMAHWKLDECTGTTAYDSSGKVNNGTITPGDSSGDNDTAGTCNSGTSTEMWNDGTSGKFNSSLGFDGTNDYVQIPASNIFTFSATQSFALSAWIKTTATGSKQILQRFSSGDNSYYRLVMSGDCGGNGTVGFDIRDSNNIELFTCTTQTFNDGQWHHLVGVRNTTSDTLEIWVDGVLRHSQNDTTTGIFPSIDPVWIGVHATNFGNILGDYFNGLIDDVRLYNYALSPAQIRTVYNENSAIRFGPLTGSP